MALDFTKLESLEEQFRLWLELKQEYRSPGARALAEEAEKRIEELIGKAKSLEEEEELKKLEPDDLEEIRALRPDGPRSLLEGIRDEDLEDQMLAAVRARFAACVLGVPVECFTIQEMKDLALYSGTPFPPTEYWHGTNHGDWIQYTRSPRVSFLKQNMTACPADDDINYTLVGLEIMEKYGFGFTTEDIAEYWKEHLGFTAFTAELAVLHNLADGVEPRKAADVNNPYVQYIGAFIRSDPWAYACAGQPEKAAEFAWRDAYLTHRRNGIYGEMYFAAAQAAAFATRDIRKALEIGLTEIPQCCTLAEDIRWALSEADSFSDWETARKKVDERFPGLNAVHTNNNACLVIFALLHCDGDFTKLASEIVAMGLDNDCTAATAGSIFGAVYGTKAIPSSWTDPFHDTVETYIKGIPTMSISDVAKRFAKLAHKNR